MNRLQLRFRTNPDNAAYGSVDLGPLSREAMSQLRRADPSLAQWQQAFSVFVAEPGRVECEEDPPVLGRYELLSDGARFTPRFPLVKGLQYGASADFSVLLGKPEWSAPPLVFSLPREPEGSSADVDAIFPSSDTLPENLLR